MYQYNTQLRVRYAETDQMGFVYYGNYAIYFEVARVEALRNLGISYKNLEENGILMPVLENYSKYHKPAKYDDLLTIEVTIREFPKSSITFNYKIYNTGKELLHSGSTKLAFINKMNEKPVRLPEIIANVLKPHFNEN